MSGEKQSWLSRLFGRSTEVDAAQAPAGKAASPAAEWAIGQRLLDDFVIERVLGQGGMGKVYLVRSQSGGQQFAVKRTLLRNPEQQRNFLTELQTWIDLPEHPHLAACRFFRTVGGEVVIFAEYIDGGSLADWIRDHKLTTLEQILDVAIQFAWGLHAAHEHGLIHQDVKPANVLMTADGIAKVADFGLARARAKAGAATPQGPQSILLSTGGMTPAYCSPDQADGKPLSRQTDVWSWGLSVLEMFTGGVTWSSGVAAADVLEDFLTTGPTVHHAPALPRGLADVLRKCFELNPPQRWPTMADAADALTRLYRQAVGQAYARRTPVPTKRTVQDVTAHDRRMAGGARWTDPQEWLIKAYQAVGKDPVEAKANCAPCMGSRKAQAIADLAIYEEARQIYERLVAADRTDLLAALARLYYNKALVHMHLDDIPGAIALFDLTVDSCERLAHQEAHPDLVMAHALQGMAYISKAVAFASLGDNRAAVVQYDQTIAFYERLVHQEGRRELANHLALTYVSKGDSIQALGDERAAVDLYDQAIAIYEQLVHQEDRRELVDRLSAAYLSKANALAALGDKKAAMPLHDRAIAIREQLVNQEGRRELAGALATSYLNKATTVGDLGDWQAAVTLNDQAIAIYEQLVHQEGRRELAYYLAYTYMNKAAGFNKLEKKGSCALYDQAIAILERLVQQEGRYELVKDLAKCYTDKATTVGVQGDIRAAMPLHDQAIALHERLVYQDGHQELANDLANTYLNKANALYALGDNRTAVVMYDKGITIVERLVHQEGKSEFQGVLAWGMVNRSISLRNLGECQRAQADVRRAIDILQPEVARTGRADLQRTLNRAKTALEELL